VLIPAETINEFFSFVFQHKSSLELPNSGPCTSLDLDTRIPAATCITSNTILLFQTENMPVADLLLGKAAKLISARGDCLLGCCTI
jgi:hypothetical protein